MSDFDMTVYNATFHKLLDTCLVLRHSIIFEIVRASFRFPYNLSGAELILNNFKPSFMRTSNYETGSFTVIKRFQLC